MSRRSRTPGRLRRRIDDDRDDPPHNRGPIALRSETRPIGKGRRRVLGMPSLASALREAGIDPEGDVDILPSRDGGANARDRLR